MRSRSWSGQFLQEVGAEPPGADRACQTKFTYSHSYTSCSLSSQHTHPYLKVVRKWDG
jgi:hypothetical protein